MGDRGSAREKEPYKTDGRRQPLLKNPGEDGRKFKATDIVY